MALCLWDEFGKYVSIQSMSRALASVGWSKKAARQVAKEQNAELRDFYLRNLSGFRSYHLVFESGCDKRAGFRRTAGPLSGLRRFTFPSSIVIEAIRYFLHILRTGSSYDGFSKALRMPIFLRILSNSFFSTATGGQRQSLFLSWITLLSTGRRTSSGCARMLALS